MNKYFVYAVLFLSAACANAQSHRIIVERDKPPADTVKAAPDTSRRMVIDPGEMIYQMQVDSINKRTEEKIRDLIISLEKKFEDPVVENEVGKLIGEAVMEQQMALLDLQIERAISVKDTLLLKGLEIALQELLQNSDVIREQVQKQLNLLEKELSK
ncbi:hypothetical protein EHM69_07785 [candidate division KSB1 bacterium]|nr:MAG: hypothetical protein EHM69_07785 [candidate division KSB1 bacterium]